MEKLQEAVIAPAIMRTNQIILAKRAATAIKRSLPAVARRNTGNKYLSNKKKSSYSSSKNKGRADTYDVHSYKDSQSFADDKYEEFYDYEDDYDDEDEAYDDAEDYWYDNY